MLLLLACTGEPLDTGDATDTGVAAPEFGVLADDIPGGVLLSGWWDGTQLRMVGGTMDGSTGVFATYDGGSVCSQPAPTPTLWWIDGSSPDDWYAVGNSGTILHQVGATAVDESVPTDATLYGVWVDGERVWAVGGQTTSPVGEIWLRAEGTWALVETTEGVLFKVHGGWFAGDGIVLRQAGETRVDVTPASEPRLLTVRAASDEDVWAVGGTSGPSVVHWDGTTWSEPELDPYCVSRPLNGVWTGDGRGAWFAGFFGNVGGRLDDGTWICPDAPLTQRHMHSAVGIPDEVLFIGGNLMDGADNVGTILRYPAPDAQLTPTSCP
jgi:hypothetical protein